MKYNKRVTQARKTPQPAVLFQESLHSTLPVGSVERSALQQILHPRTVHGGPASFRRRKTFRPWNPSAPVHLILESARARGDWTLTRRRHRSRIQAMIYRFAARFQVRVYRAENCGQRLELLVKCKERKQLADFLRVLAGRVAVTVTGAKKGAKKVGKFWNHLAFSRLVNWGRDFFEVRARLGEPHLTPALASIDPNSIGTSYDPGKTGPPPD